MGSDILKGWLIEEVGLDLNRGVEKDFANGCAFGQLLHHHGMQPDFDKFVDTRHPDAMVNNFTRLQTTFLKLGVKFDTRTANSLMREEPGVAMRLLYSLKQNLGQVNKDVQKFQSSGRLGKEFGASVPVTRTLLEAQQHNTSKEKTVSNAQRFFEETMRNNAENPNMLLSSLHLRQYTEEMFRQEQAAKTGLLQEKSMMASQRSTFRSTQLTKMEAVRGDKMKKLQRDDAVHATLLQHKEDVEREELRVELALTEKARRRKLEELAHASLDVNHGIDAFEINMKRLVKGDAGDDEGEVASGKGPGTLQGGSPMDHMLKMRGQAVSPSKLLEGSAAYTAAVAAQRAEDVATKREREARRRRVVVEQLQAAEAAAAKSAEDEIVATLAKQSLEEQKLAERFWQLRQEKEVMRENRLMREQQYAERRDKDWESSLMREAELRRSMREQYEEQARVEMEALEAGKQARAAAKAAKHAAMCKEIAWQIVMLAERGAEHRATAGANVPALEYRRWLAMFTSGDPSLGDPVTQPEDRAAEAAAREAASDRDRQLAQATVQDYLHCLGEWKRSEEQGGSIGFNEPLGAAVADLVGVCKPGVDPSDLPSLPYPLRLAVVGAPFSGKTSVSQDLARRYKLKVLDLETLVAEAIKAASEYVAPPPPPPPPTPPPPTEGAEAAADEAQAPEEVPPPPEVPPLVVIGREAQDCLAQGRDLPDHMAVELIVRAMKAVGDKPPPAEVDPKAKAPAKGKSAAPAEPEQPPQGFVVDGFPRTASQSQLLERALTGLNLEQEAELIAAASVLAPPPSGSLPHLQRPLRSGLDAVLVLGMSDESVALKRALGRRVDPETGRMYHIEFDPPAASDPGLAARLKEVVDPSNDAVQIQRRLTAYTATAAELDDWLKRFVKLRRPIDGAGPHVEVMESASDAALGIVRARQAVASAEASVVAAGKAREASERAAEFAELAQGHAEGAARELLSAKKAEMAATALLADPKSKVQDAAATEVLKAQSAARCAEQLKVAKAAATDASGYAERAQEAATAAGEAKARAEASLGDAEVNASAEEQAKVHAEAAEAARKGAAEAAAKAETARAAAEVAAAEAERIFAKETVAPDEAVNLAPAVTKSAEEVAAEAAALASAAAAPASPVPLPKPLAEALLAEWRTVESSYLEGLTLAFVNMSEQHATLLAHFSGVRETFKELLVRPDSRASTVCQFQHAFNAIDVDARRLKETKAELVLRAEELRDSLWAACDRKMESAEAERGKLASDSFVADQSAMVSQYFVGALQVELDRLYSTKNVLQGYTRARYGVLPAAATDADAVDVSEEADPLLVAPDLLSGVPPPDLKDKLDEKSKSAMQFPTWVSSLVPKAPTLATGLKVALATIAGIKESLTPGAGDDKGGKGGKKDAKAGKGAPVAVEAQIDPKAKEAIDTEIAAAGLREAEIIERRVELLAERASASIEFVSEAARGTSEALAGWIKRRFQAECSAVLALDKVIKGAVLSGTPLGPDLRLEDDCLVVDEGTLLVPPPEAPSTPNSRESSPGAGLLSITQLSGLTRSFTAIAPEGWIRLTEAAQVLCSATADGTLPEGWAGASLPQMVAALRPFDLTNTSYVDWRELMCALVAATFPAIMKASCADMADQVTMLAEVDDNRDGFLTEAQWSKVELWFQYKAFLPGGEDDLEGPSAILNKQEHEQAYDRAGALKTVLWEIFAQQPPGQDGEGAPQIDFKAVLLYLCSDRDMFTGIKKAFSVATSSVVSNARAVAEQVHTLAYPLQGAVMELAGQIGRAPFDLEGVREVVGTIFESRKPKPAAAAEDSKGGKGGAKAKGGKATATSAIPDPIPEVSPLNDVEASISAEQLMYSAGGEKLVAQLLHRYQWKDVYVLSKML